MSRNYTVIVYHGNDYQDYRGNNLKAKGNSVKELILEVRDLYAEIFLESFVVCEIINLLILVWINMANVNVCFKRDQMEQNTRSL